MKFLHEVLVRGKHHGVFLKRRGVWSKTSGRLKKTLGHKKKSEQAFLPGFPHLAHFTMNKAPSNIFTVLIMLLYK